MINGLQLTIPGEEVRQLLEQRMEGHRQQKYCREDWRLPRDKLSAMSDSESRGR